MRRRGGWEGVADVVFGSGEVSADVEFGEGCWNHPGLGIGSVVRVREKRD